MERRQKEIDSALAEQLDAMEGSSTMDASHPGRRSVGGGYTLMTFGAAPSHPPVEEDDYHEPELSQPTQFPFFPTPADEKDSEGDEDSAEKEPAETSATLVVSRSGEIAPPPAKRQKIAPREEEVADTTPIDLDPPTPIPAAKAKSRDVLSLDDDIIRSPSQSESEDLPPVTQANPIRKAAESSDDERAVLSDLGGDSSDLDDDAMVVEATPKPPKRELSSGKASSQNSKRGGATQDEDEESFGKEPTSARRIEPEISDSEDEPPTTQAPPPKEQSAKPAEADEPRLSKYLNRNKVKGHKLEPPPKPAKKEAAPPPSPRKKGEPKKSESKKSETKKSETKKAARKEEAPSKEKRKKKDPFAMEVVEDDQDEDVFIETRPTKTRVAASPNKKSKKETAPSRSGKRNAKKRKRESSAEEDSFVEDDEEENNVASFPADDGDDEEEVEESEEDIEELEKMLGAPKPRPKAPPKPRVAPKLTLFSGMTFIVTGIKEDAEVKADELKNVIKSFGGQIKNERPTARPKTNTKRPVPSCVLISDVPQRTYKWIMALATCVPMLHYRWVQDCVAEGRIIDPLTDKKKYLLPAGTNYDGKMVPYPQWFLEENPDKEEWEIGVFWQDKDQCRIDVVGVKEFRDQWRKVVIAAGAKAPDPDRLSEKTARTDFVLSDSQPSQLNASNAEAKKLPLCGHEWVIQSLIAHECLDPAAHPSLTIKVADGPVSDSDSDE